MSVSNYLAKSENSCKYTYNKLKDVLYLVSEEHIKDIIIDNGEAYISGLTELPIRINGFNISLKEEASLDERWKFQKTITLSMHGYVNYKIFEGKHYAIVESEDGTYWMVNVDYPSRITHTFNLSQNTNQTDFTFASLSNFPTLKLNAEFEAVSPVCLGLNVYGIDKLELLEIEKARLEVENKTLYTTEDFKKIEFLGNSCSFQEVYDGFKVTDTITFDIAFNNYKPSWQYNLLEFLDNRYSAIITPRGGDNTYYTGFNFGLEPTYTIQTQSNKGQSDIITITLTEASSYGLTAAVDWDESQHTQTRWRYVKKVGDVICYECIGNYRARYLVRQEVDYFGNPTGNYQVMDGYQSQYPMFNIVDTFNEQVEFDTADCGSSEICNISTNIPSTIVFTTSTCNTYSLSASCDWHISNVPSYITVSPLSGESTTTYNLNVCNSKTPTSTVEQSSFNINCCSTVRNIPVIIGLDNGCITPATQSINCLGQTVQFTYNGNCQISISSIDPRLTYSIGYNTLTIQVPRNNTTSAITWTISAINCNCESGTSTVAILQDKTYERWVEDTGYICESGNSYTVERRYTGTTSDNINTVTDETRKGTLIQSGDTRCGGTSDYIFDGHYYCVDGDKYKALEQVFNGQKTGKTKLGELVESASSWCNQEVTYKWVLTDLWQCGGVKLFSTYQDSTQYVVECTPYPNLQLSSAETRGHSSSYSSMTTADIGDCVVSIGGSAFNDCSGLTSVLMPSGLSIIGDYSFYRCFNLTSVNIPNNVQHIGNSAFEDCRGITTMMIPSNVQYIGNTAFAFCDSLTSINIPSGVTEENIGYMGTDVLHGCSSLINVTLPSGLKEIPEGTFAACTSLPKVHIPKSVTSIGEDAFWICHSLSSVTIPSGVTTIGDRAFYNCSGLTGLTILATTPPTLELKDMSGHTEIETFDEANYPIYVPCESVGAYKTAYRWTKYADRIHGIPPCESPKKLTATYSNSTTAEVECSSSTTLTRAEITGLSGSYSSMTRAEIGTCTIAVGNDSFVNCTSLTSLTIPTSVTSIGQRAFYQCSGLTSVDIPSGVTSIGRNAFDGCKSLSSVTVDSITPPTLESGYTTFGGSDYMLIYVPSGAVTIYKSASGWSQYACRIVPIGYTPPTPPAGEIKLTVKYCNNVNDYIGCNGSDKLTQNEVRGLSLPYGDITYAGIGGCVEIIYDNAFYRCYSLTSVDIPSGITSIGNYAFYACTDLTSVDIPSGVTSIGGYAFNSCRSLASITIKAATPPTLPDPFVFENTNNCPIYVPSGSVDTYKNTSLWNTYASRIQAIP